MSGYYDAGSVVASAIKRGLLVKQPCRDCGALVVDAHHPDYSRPLDVIWLCRRHHADEHKRLRNAGVALHRRRYARSITIGIRMPVKMLERLRAMASVQGRSTANMAILILQEAINGKKSIR